MKIDSVKYNQLKSQHKKLQTTLEDVSLTNAPAQVKKLHELNTEFMGFVDELFSLEVKENKPLDLTNPQKIIEKLTNYSQSVSRPLLETCLNNTSKAYNPLIQNVSTIATFAEKVIQAIFPPNELKQENQSFDFTVKSRDEYCLELIKKNLESFAKCFEEQIPVNLKDRKLALSINPISKKISFDFDDSNLFCEESAIEIARRNIILNFLPNVLAAFTLSPPDASVTFEYAPKNRDDSFAFSE